MHIRRQFANHLLPSTDFGKIALNFSFPPPRDELEREIGEDQASLAAKCPTENALRASMPDCESGSLRDFILSKRAALQELP